MASALERVTSAMVEAWRAGDRLASRGKKVQDLFVDAKVPRSEREAWPLVVKGDEVVVVPGIATDPATTMGALVSRAQLDRVLNGEREIKHAQLTLMVRIKDQLSEQQQMVC